jgi:BCD family chlorophyll transporter-like MFS transporter
MLSVLALGILNRVMKVELGISLGLTSVVIGIHYFAAPLAIPFGHRSDRRAYFGYRRTPFIIAGAAMTMLATALAPLSALWMGTARSAMIPIVFGVAVFFLLGLGIYTAGTAYLSLIADLTQERERGRVVAIVWSMMMLGILTGVFVGSAIVGQYSAGRLITLFLLMALLVGALTLISIWGIEPKHRERDLEGSTDHPGWKVLIRARQSRLFFLFLFSGILFLFLQNTILEPFGGDVFGLSIAETTRFNADQMVGVLAGMGIAGGWVSKRFGNRFTTGVGLGIAGISFALLTLMALSGQGAWIRVAVLLMGLGMGFFNVGGLSIMMGMSLDGKTGLFMGAWTLAQAMANGIASWGGGLIHDLVLSLGGPEGLSYGAVFLVEAVGTVVAIILLLQLDLVEFRAQSVEGPELLTEIGA